VRRRFRREKLIYGYILDATLRAVEYRLASENHLSARQQVSTLRQEFKAEIGSVGQWIGAAAAPILFGASLVDQLRVARGWTYEPSTLIERRNWTR
jgi:hypothetical protein